jgi:hypothetical protein
MGSLLVTFLETSESIIELVPTKCPEGVLSLQERFCRSVPGALPAPCGQYIQYINCARRADSKLVCRLVKPSSLVSRAQAMTAMMQFRIQCQAHRPTHPCSSDKQPSLKASWRSWRDRVPHRAAARRAGRLRAAKGDGEGSEFNIDELAKRLSAEAEKMRLSGASMDLDALEEEEDALARSKQESKESLLQPLGMEVREAPGALWARLPWLGLCPFNLCIDGAWEWAEKAVVLVPSLDPITAPFCNSGNIS